MSASAPSSPSDDTVSDDSVLMTLAEKGPRGLIQ
jgi:hypothetical protein